MRTKTEIGNLRLYLFWSLLKIPRFFSFTGNCKQKIWLKQLKAVPVLDFPYFQHVSKLVTHHRSSGCNDFRYIHFFIMICEADHACTVSLSSKSSPHLSVNSFFHLSDSSWDTYPMAAPGAPGLKRTTVLQKHCRPFFIISLL